MHWNQPTNHLAQAFFPSVSSLSLAHPDTHINGPNPTDTHRHRLGTNYQQIPINRPFNARVRNYQRDGPMTVDGNQVGG